MVDIGFLYRNETIIKMGIIVPVCPAIRATPHSDLYTVANGLNRLHPNCLCHHCDLSLGVYVAVGLYTVIHIGITEKVAIV